MKDKEPSCQLIHPLEIYHDYLTTINDIGLTQREIDVISCLLYMGPRSRKYIANLLFIDVKTVNLHVSNAANKLVGYCNIDRLMVFLESSAQACALKTYYLALLTDNLFKKTLKEEIKLLIHKNSSLNCVMVYWQKKPHFLESLKKDLAYAGLEVSVEIRKGVPSFHELIEENHPGTYSIYFLPNTLVERQQSQSTTEEATQFSHTKILFFPRMKNPIIASQELPQFTLINPSGWTSYYDSVFVILKKIIPDNDLEKIFTRFEEKANALHSSPFSLPSQPRINEISKEGEVKENDDLQTRQVFASKRVRNILVGISSMGIFLLWVLTKDDIKKSHQDKTNEISFQNDSIVHRNITNQPIRSDLIVPVQSTLLNRSNLLIQIDRHFKKQPQDIQTIALVGIGGAGKTVLARQYARSQNLPVIWEMNAETKNSIRNSFENLAYALSKTEEEKKTLRDLKNIKDITERERIMIQLVKNHLRSYSNWLLIYDNVENFSDLQKYFPSDPKAWGSGRIIITTHDANIQNNQLVNYTLPIKELDQEEKLQLFMNIMKTENGSPFALAQKKQAQQFLSFIPSYPLDISIAAYYLKTTQVSYEKYLKYMAEHDTSFEAIQKKILQAANDYIKTRYYITTLTIKRLIEEQEDFKGLLLFISLLDSQNIPKDLLDAYQSSMVVDNFIYSLKKYSLVTQESSSIQPIPFLSIHRSTQAISLNYFTHGLNLNKRDFILQRIVDTIEKYMDKAIEDEGDILSMQNHCEVLFSHAPLFTDRAKASLRCILGMIYCRLTHFEKSRQIIEENLNCLNKNERENYPVLARTFAYLGMVYRILGDYEKAKEFLEQSLVVYRQYKSANDIKEGWVFVQLGIVYKELGDYEKAIKFIEEGLILYKKHFFETHPQMAWVLSTLGIVYRDNGDYKKAKDLLEQCLTIYKNKFSKNHMRIAWVLGHLGKIEQEVGNYEKAKVLLEKSLQVHEKHLTKRGLFFAWTLANLGNVHIDLGNPTKAKDLLEKSLTLFGNFPHDPIEVARILVMLAKAYMNLGYLEKAKNLIERSFLIYENPSHKKTFNFADALKIYGQVHLYKGDFFVTEKYLRKSLKIYQKIGHSDIYRVLEDLADLYFKKSIEALNEQHVQQSQGFKVQAISYLKEARETVIATFSEDSLHNARIQSKLKKLECK